MRGSGVPVTATALALAGCRGWQSVADPQGPQAAQLDALIWLVRRCLPRYLGAGDAGARRGALAAERCLPNRGSGGTAWFVGGAMAASVLVILGLTVASYVTTRAHLGRAGRPAGHPAEGLPVVVGGILCGRATRRQLHHRQRTARPRRPPGARRTRGGGRDPFLLGAQSGRQAGPDPRPQQFACLHRRSARHLSRAVRGVLRPAARAYGAAGGRRVAG